LKQAVLVAVSVAMGVIIAGGGFLAYSVLSPAAVPPAEAKGLSTTEIQALMGAFSDEPLQGGQNSPRFSKFVNEDVFVFLQFDTTDPTKASLLRYIGIGVKGVFCAEAQPDGPSGGFNHFHRLNAPVYSQGHGGPPGEIGYWLLFIAATELNSSGRQVTPGVDYGFSPTPPPSCGASVPEPNFDPPEASNLTSREIITLAGIYGDNPLDGGQVAPRVSKWVNEDVWIFLQFNNTVPANAGQLRYMGLGLSSTFCSATQPHTDFRHFHRTTAAAYAQGHGGDPGVTGFWLLFIAAMEFDSGPRHLTPGVDREFSPTAPPTC
jgi:hypothetical protein